MSSISEQYEQSPSFRNVLIASYPQQSVNYYKAVTSAGFQPCSPFTGTDLSFTGDQNPTHPFPVLFDLAALTFDLLLLPGGGDISPKLYHQKNLGSHSPDYELDLIQFQLLQLAVLRKKPVLGICKGMQLINVFFGGDLCQHLPTTDFHSTPGKDCFHELFFPPEFPHHSHIAGQQSSAKGLYNLLSEHRIVNSCHHQGVAHLGKNLCCIQYSEDYLPETILHSELPILGLQWHPERLPEFCSQSFAELLHLLLHFKRL